MTGVSVVVCSRDRPDALARALAVLHPALRPVDEVVVVDSASRDGRTQAVAEAAGARVERATRPGLSHARNVGVGASTRDILAFTDDDCRVDPRWCATIERAFGDTRIGLVTGPVLGASAVSTIDRAVDVSFTAPTAPAELGHGANMAFRRHALTDAGPFDEALGAGSRFRAADDWDMFWRVLQAGWTATYVPGAVVHHDQWRTRWQAVRTRYGYSLGAAAFAEKLRRAGEPLGPVLLRDRVRHEGLGAAARGVRRRRPGLVAIGAANIAGCAAGTWRARRQ